MTLDCIGLVLLLSLALPSAASNTAPTLPIIDVGPLVRPSADAHARAAAIKAIGEACMNQGFFYVVNTGVDEACVERLQECAKTFFAQPREVKRSIEMAKAGARWRGYFEVGEEFTSGIVDEKEGLYFAAERPEDKRPLHGENQWPDENITPGMRDVVLDYMDSMSCLAKALLEAIAASIGLDATHFGKQFADPTTLFRIFHYPPHDARWGGETFAVGEHTDYGKSQG